MFDFSAGLLLGILIGLIVGVVFAWLGNMLLESINDGSRCSGNCNQGRNCSCK